MGAMDSTNFNQHKPFIEDVMTITALVAFIGLQCGINPATNIPRAQKELCMERIINCAVGLDGVVRPDAATVCIKKEQK